MTPEVAQHVKPGWTVAYCGGVYIVVAIRKQGVAEPIFTLLKLNGTDVMMGVPCRQAVLHRDEMFAPRDGQFAALSSAVGADLSNL